MFVSKLACLNYNWTVIIIIIIIIINCRYGHKLTHPKCRSWYIKVSQITDTIECHIYQINLSNLKWLNIQLYDFKIWTFINKAVGSLRPRVQVHIWLFSLVRKWLWCLCYILNFKFRFVVSVLFLHPAVVNILNHLKHNGNYMYHML
jgi:hypothetical protein